MSQVNHPHKTLKIPFQPTRTWTHGTEIILLNPNGSNYNGLYLNCPKRTSKSLYPTSCFSSIFIHGQISKSWVLLPRVGFKLASSVDRPPLWPLSHRHGGKIKFLFLRFDYEIVFFRKTSLNNCMMNTYTYVKGFPYRGKDDFKIRLYIHILCLNLVWRYSNSVHLEYQPNP